jgi:hypothetical protein
MEKQKENFNGNLKIFVPPDFTTFQMKSAQITNIEFSK